MKGIIGRVIMQSGRGFDDYDFCGRVLPENKIIKSKCSYYEEKIKEIVAIERRRKAQRTLRRVV